MFCGSSGRVGQRYRDEAVALARALVDRGLTLVYGGAQVGTMGALADAVLAAGGQVTGVIPVSMTGRELAHEHLTTLHVVGSMHERKALMVELSDAFVALPGGFGTLDELAEVLTWAQLGLHGKPIGLLSRDGFFEGLLGFFDHAVTEGFVARRWRERLLVAEEPETLLDRLAAGAGP